jgi:hypothetical protein
MNVFVVEGPNRPGELARMAEALAARGINILPYGIGGGSGRWAAAVVASDEEASRSALTAAGIAHREFPVLYVRMEDVPGQAAAASRKLAAAGINIELWLPVDTSKEGFTVAVAVDDVEAAQEVLGDQLTDWSYR